MSQKKLFIAELEVPQKTSELFVTESELSEIQGGSMMTTMALGEEGGCPIAIPDPIKLPPIKKPPIYSTMMVGEEGGCI